MATKTSLPCLYIPDDSAPDQRAEEKILEFPPSKGFDDIVCKLLGCEFRAVETVFSDDEFAVLNGNKAGLPAGQPFTIYEVYMDDNGNSTRPNNSLAARLLGRLKSHGPMILIKLICSKLENGQLKVIRKECVTIDDIENAAFQNKREVYATKKREHNRAVMELFIGQGAVVVDLD